MINEKRFITLFLNLWDYETGKDRYSDFDEVVELAQNIGMTRLEFIDLLTESGNYIPKTGWKE